MSTISIRVERAELIDSPLGGEARVVRVEFLTLWVFLLHDDEWIFHEFRVEVDVAGEGRVSSVVESLVPLSISGGRIFSRDHFGVGRPSFLLFVW